MNYYIHRLQVHKYLSLVLDLSFALLQNLILEIIVVEIFFRVIFLVSSGYSHLSNPFLIHWFESLFLYPNSRYLLIFLRLCSEFCKKTMIVYKKQYGSITNRFIFYNQQSGSKTRMIHRGMGGFFFTGKINKKIVDQR